MEKERYLNIQILLSRLVIVVTSSYLDLNLYFIFLEIKSNHTLSGQLCVIRFESALALGLVRPFAISCYHTPSNVRSDDGGSMNGLVLLLRVKRSTCAIVESRAKHMCCRRCDDR